MYDYLISLYGQSLSQSYGALSRVDARSSYILIIKSISKKYLIVIGYDGSGWSLYNETKEDYAALYDYCPVQNVLFEK